MDPDIYDLHIAAGRAYGQTATCGVKIDYKTEERATRAALDMRHIAVKPLEAYPCAWCSGWHIGRKMTYEELQAAAAAGAAEGKTTMELFGKHDPAGSDGYVPGAWDEVRAAYMDGHISEEAYDVLQKQMELLRGYEEPQ